MKTAIIVFTGIYFKFDDETKETRAMFNYVVTDGDVKGYIKDKESQINPKSGKNCLSLQTQDENNTVLPEHIGLPRFVSTTDLGQSVEINRAKRQDGSFDWFVDNTLKVLIASAVKSMSTEEKTAYAKDSALEKINGAKATAERIIAMRKAQASVVTDLKTK
jgi:hypothetical protein